MLAELERATDERDAQARAVEQAEARLAEWRLEPTATDAALDFYSQCRDVIRGRIREAKGVAELNAALADLLAGVWVGVRRNGWLGADFVLRAPDEEPWLFTIRPNWTEPKAPPWLRAKLDASPWCTSSR